jgi:hypothetical protein
MASTTKSFDVLLAEFRTVLRAINRRLDTSDNSLAKDFLLTPYSVGAKGIHDQIVVARNLHILSQISGFDLDNEATNYGLERSVGTYSSVTLNFFATTLPTTDVVVPAGTSVQTSESAFITATRFSTISDVRISVSSMATYYSYDRDRYEFSVFAQCDSIGIGGNVGSETITKLVGSVATVSGVTNLLAASGGTDSESDDDFRERIRLAKTGRDLNTVNGLRAFVKGLGFIDAYPVRTEDPSAERATGVDAFVVDTSATAVNETFLYSPSKQKYYFTNRPVRSVTAVVAAIAGTLAISEYDAFIDATSPMRRSVSADDYIEIRLSAGLAAGEPFTVTYTYAENIVTAQNTLSLVTNKILTADVLLKKAYTLYFYMNATLTLFANSDGPTTRAKVKNALAQFLSGYRLGQNLQKSDIIIVLQQGYGDYPVASVDAVVISSYYLQDEYGVVYMPTDEVIAVGDKQYIVYGSATVV